VKQRGGQGHELANRRREQVGGDTEEGQARAEE